MRQWIRDHVEVYDWISRYSDNLLESNDMRGRKKAWQRLCKIYSTACRADDYDYVIKRFSKASNSNANNPKLPQITPELKYHKMKIHRKEWKIFKVMRILTGTKMLDCKAFATRTFFNHHCTEHYNGVLALRSNWQWKILRARKQQAKNLEIVLTLVRDVRIAEREKNTCPCYIILSE